MIEALAGVLGAVHLRQPWLGGACLAFIAVLALAWSHLGPSGRIHEDAKARAEKAQQELDTARSTLEDINRQIEEANK